MVERRGGEAELRQFSVSDPDSVKKAFKEILDEHGRIDVLVNNAGIAKDNLLALMKPSEWDEVMNTNLKGAFLCPQAVVKPMMRQRFGRIISVTSVVGVIGNSGQCNYSAAKAGIIGFTRSLAREIISRNITVNAVAPGFIETDMTLALPEKAREVLLTQIPAAQVRRPGRCCRGRFVPGVRCGGVYNGPGNSCEWRYVHGIGAKRVPARGKVPASPVCGRGKGWH